jgi:hypothetical protein
MDPSVDRLDRGKLFFVGDEKQSIYLFRGADVSVFKQLKHELGSAGGVSLSLNTNYRSEPRLIDHLNDLFKRVMNNDGQPWEADFSPLSTRMPSPGIAPSITFCFKPMHSEDAAADEPDSDDEDGGELAHASEAEAVHLADLIATMLDSDSYLIPDGAGGRRRPAPNDIAILLKSTGGQLSYERALRAKGIPYTLQIPRALLMEAPANDLYNLLQLALYPEDRLAYVASLRSPFCRMSDTGVLAVIGKYDEAPYLGVPYPVDEGVVGELESALSASDLARYRIAAETFGNLAGRWEEYRCPGCFHTYGMIVHIATTWSATHRTRCISNITTICGFSRPSMIKEGMVWPSSSISCVRVSVRTRSSPTSSYF